MTANIPRTLPFSSWDEWVTVKNGMYSGINDQIMRSLEIVALWRMRGRLPLSVDCTANLAELKLRDIHIPGIRVHSVNELKLLYSAVVVRAVNGLVDPSQQGIFATSVLTLAERIGLPGWIVEIRHDATHNQMPSLSVLRSAANALFGWYYDYYWNPQWNLLQNLSASSIPIPAVIVTSTSSNNSSKQQNNNVTTSDTVESTWQQDCSPTFVTEIFMPMFCGATVYSANNIELSETKDIETQLKTFNVQQKSLWESRLIDIMKANSNTLHVIIIHLLDTVKQGHKQYLSRYINIKLYIIQLKITLYWLKELTEGEYSRISSSVSRKSSSQQLQILAQNSNNISNNMNNNQNKRIYSNVIVNFIQTMLANIRTDCNSSNNNSDIVQLKEVLHMIIVVVEQFYSIPSIENIPNTGTTTNTAGATTSITATTTGTGTSSSSSLGKRKQEVAAVVKTKNNTTTTTTTTTTPTTKNANNMIRKSVDFPVWPLGCLPGQLSTGALFLVEDTE